MNCLSCDAPLIKRDQKKFCSKSCSTTYNNIARSPIRFCHCGTKLLWRQKYNCSPKCAGITRTKYTDEERKRISRAKHNEAWHRYNARKKNQTPHGVDIAKLQEIYLNCPEGYEVDHKIPISKGGLHCPSNLQYLPWLENRKKSNKLS